MSRSHILNILSKLQLADQAEAILRAREAGLGWFPSSDSHILQTGRSPALSGTSS